MKESPYKLSVVINLLRTGKECTLHVCRMDKNRPAKNGERLELKDVSLISYEAYDSAKVRLKNGQPVTIKPIHIEYYNQTRVIP